LTDEASQNFTFGYDIANKLTSKTMPNGISSTFDYDGIAADKAEKSIRCDADRYSVFVQSGKSNFTNRGTDAGEGIHLRQH
jgi:YD repeat-containing protein